MSEGVKGKDRTFQITIVTTRILISVLLILACAGCHEQQTWPGYKAKPTVVGNLCYSHDIEAHTFTFWEFRTNRMLRITDDGFGKSKGTLPYPGIPIWDSPNRRLFIIGQNDGPNDTKDIVEMIGDGWQKGKRVWLSDYAMGFDSIVGNPDVGPFAVFESSNRERYLTGLFRRDLSRIKTDAIDVADIGPQGILAIRGERDPLQTIKPTELICIEPRSGKVRWRNSKHVTGKWEGKNVRSGDDLLNGKTGKPTLK